MRLESFLNNQKLFHCALRVLICILLFVVGVFPLKGEAFRVMIEPNTFTTTSKIQHQPLFNSQTKIFSLYLDTEEDVINMAELKLAFQPYTVDVIAVEKGDSIFPLWMSEPEVDRKKGEITFIAGIPSPGFQGVHGKLADITLQVIEQGDTSLEILPTSVVYLNDGFGTQIGLTSDPSQHSEIFFVKEETKTQPSVQISDFFSLSHPRAHHWYTDRDVVFEWAKGENGTKFNYVFNQEPEMIPNDSMRTDVSSVNLHATSDGRWYFHVHAMKDGVFGETIHARVQIDSESPEPFSINMIEPTEAFENQYAIVFLTTDAMSGVSHYEIQEKNRMMIVSEAPYVLLDQEPGRHKIMVTATDFAENKTTSTIVVEIPRPLRFYIFWGGSGIVFLSALSLFYFTLRRFYYMV